MKNYLVAAAITLVLLAVIFRVPQASTLIMGLSPAGGKNMGK
jgi:hypothetical protein